MSEALLQAARDELQEDLEYNTELTHPDREGDQLLNWATYNGYLKLVSRLLKAGLSPNSALEEALLTKNLAMITLLEAAITNNQSIRMEFELGLEWGLKYPGRQNLI